MYCTQLYEMFMGPLEAVKPWQANQLMGVVRFREKIFNLVRSQVEKHPSLMGKLDDALLRDMHKVTKKVTSDIDRMAFNTAISNLMIYANSLVAAAKANSNSGGLPRETLETLVLLVSPFAPHVAEECWALLGHEKTLAYHAWPSHQEELCLETRCVVAVQVNGKVRGTLEVDGAEGLTQEGALAEAMLLSRVQHALSDKQPKKVIYVPGKVLNIIV